MNLPYSFIGDYVYEDIRIDLWQRTENITFEDVNNISYKSKLINKHKCKINIFQLLCCNISV